ncbi:MAG TPA: response regulator transcription factor [Planctomycetaceae bacterium]|jgi:DNA-binding response OmpR family regulator
MDNRMLDDRGSSVRGPDDRKNGRVLVVDDDRQFLEATRTMLEEHGYDVVTAHDGSEGLMQAERESPDLIVLDLMMPRRSGFGVLDHLGHPGRPGPCIVVVTANEEQRHEEIARAKGADAFLKKPFEMHELLSAVNSLLKA